MSSHSLKIEKQLETLIYLLLSCSHYQHIVARTSHLNLKANAKDYVSRHLMLLINQRPPLVRIVTKPSTSSPRKLVVGIIDLIANVRVVGRRASTHLNNMLKQDTFGQISIVDGTATPVISSGTNLATMDHHIITKGEWGRLHITKHPIIELKISLDNDTKTSATVIGIADTVAQSDLWSLNDFLQNGF